jgi:hypothetical protein
MPYKNKEEQRTSQQKWYQKNKERHNATVKSRRKMILKWVKDYKNGLKCERCSENHPACLQFHHKDPSKKVLGIRQAVKRNWSVKRIQAEILKCEVLCANCHVKEHNAHLFE